jgi:hypothetical protein
MALHRLVRNRQSMNQPATELDSEDRTIAAICMLKRPWSPRLPDRT